MDKLTHSQRNFMMNNFVHGGMVEHNVAIHTDKINKIQASLLRKGYLKKRFSQMRNNSWILLEATEKGENYLARKLGLQVRYQVGGHEYKGKQYVTKKKIMV